ncbi:hypothetical protein D3C83_103060 [compost metagenome]
MADLVRGHHRPAGRFDDGGDFLEPGRDTAVEFADDEPVGGLIHQPDAAGLHDLGRLVDDAPDHRVDRRPLANQRDEFAALIG